MSSTILLWTLREQGPHPLWESLKTRLDLMLQKYLKCIYANMYIYYKFINIIDTHIKEWIKSWRSKIVGKIYHSFTNHLFGVVPIFMVIFCENSPQVTSYLQGIFWHSFASVALGSLRQSFSVYWSQSVLYGQTTPSSLFPPFIVFKFFIVFIFYLPVDLCMEGTCAAVGQRATRGVCSLPLPSGSWRWNLGCQVWEWVTLPAKSPSTHNF